MSFSDIAVAQRSKEAVAVKTFLIYSLTGSLALHIGILSSGIVNFLSRVPEQEEEPIELAIIETPQPQVTETPQPQVKPETPKTIEKTTVTPVAPQPKPLKVEEIQPQVKNVPVQKLVTPKEVQTREPISPKPTVETNSPQKIVSSSPPSSTDNAPRSNDKLLGQLRGIRDSQVGSGETPVLTGNSGNSVGTGTGTGTGTRTGTPVATAPRTPAIEAPVAPVNRNTGSGNGRAACRECNTRYPEAARRRGIEGRVEVAVDTDENGNVTKVRIARSSGNRELDEETARQARDWKLKPASGGRQGVSIATDFAIQGSRRHREAQKRRQQREAEERNRQAVANNASSTEGTRRRRRLEASSNTDNSAESIREPQTRQRRATSSSETESRISRRLFPQKVETNSVSSSSERRQSNIRESLRQTRRQPVASDSSAQSQPTRNRRRRRTQPAKTPVQSRLVESLRRSRQASPPASEAPATGNTGE
ncbi:MAG: energy transducer TonB [Goleter apudmare HA4340-LM2]|jgi:TonB family protein|nr:energy transducer TonB [Goleter apudmare HA4340-LM2]